MKITVVINTCKDCRHRTHSGSFTPGGAKPVCGHDRAIPSRRSMGDRPGYEFGMKASDRHHWKLRVLNSDLSIPNWCPIKNGNCY
jgi:hypothetical protein